MSASHLPLRGLNWIKLNVLLGKSESLFFILLEPSHPSFYQNWLYKPQRCYHTSWLLNTYLYKHTKCPGHNNPPSTFLQEERKKMARRSHEIMTQQNNPPVPMISLQQPGMRQVESFESSTTEMYPVFFFSITGSDEERWILWRTGCLPVQRTAERSDTAHGRSQLAAALIPLSCLSSLLFLGGSLEGCHVISSPSFHFFPYFSIIFSWAVFPIFLSACFEPDLKHRPFL